MFIYISRGTKSFNSRLREEATIVTDALLADETVSTHASVRRRRFRLLFRLGAGRSFQLTPP